jgi:DNA adenine methylase
MRPPSVRPVLKWAGGKSRSLPGILSELPARIDTYYEPFVGGAAVFFALAAEKRFKRAVLGDRNTELLDVYSSVQKNVEAVILALSGYKYDRDEYYRVRALNPADLDPEVRAARIIFLNKTGYNGLYRVNSKGEFNVPFGRHTKPNICDREGLRAASAVLKGVRFSKRDFERTCQDAERGDAVYFDPPYYPVSKTANFTAYDKAGFGRAEHERLLRTFEKLATRGVAVVLSNSDTPFTYKLYTEAGWRVRRISVSRPINSKSSGRGDVKELLVTTHSDP